MASPDPAPGHRDDHQDTGSRTLTAEAIIQTANPARYIARLCRHASQMSTHAAQPGRYLRHRPRGQRGGDAPPEVRHAEWSDTEGKVILNWGQWTMQAADRTLTVRAEAADEQNLQRIQDLLTARLTSFGRREHLTVNWRRPPAASEPGPATVP
jgi:hypothetical protein